MTKRVVGRPFEKGKTGNPHGRPPILRPEIQRIVESNREATKALILQELEPQLKIWVQAMIQEGIDQADPIRFKMLVEMAMGKMIEEPPEFPITEEEKMLVMEWRKRKAIQEAP